MMDVMIDPAKAQNVPEGGYTSALSKSFDGIRIGVLEPSEWHMPPHVLVPNAEAEEQEVCMSIEIE